MAESSKGSRVTGSDRTRMAAEMKKRYLGGESIRAIAADHGRSYGFVHRMLGEAGVAMRSRGGAQRGKKAAKA